jgi:hypothetical protein
MDPDLDPVIFLIALPEAKKLILKVQKKSQNIRNQGFSYQFCLMKEGSYPDPDPDPYL